MDTPALPTLDPQFVALLPYGFARAHGALVACAHDDAVEVWLREGAQPATLAELRRMLRRPLRTRLLDAARFDEALNRAYDRGEGNHAATLVGDLEQGMDLQQLAQDIPEVADLLESEDDAPIIRLLNALLAQALREQASDIHIEPYEARSVVRFRMDGALRDVIEPKRALHAAIVSRIKVMAQLDIAEKRLPQDGRITLRLGGRPVDVRVSTLPTGHGERVVMRLLDKQAGRLELGRLGMRDATLASLDALIHRPHGILLVTGPTGSGKTTTLYAALSRMDARTLNIMTVEDPIEYDLDGIGQTQVNSRIELDFARALRAILRQDPDVIMIGEIRDLETAQIAVQASLTGHLVLATLHTNDAASSVTRLVDMGIEPFLLASSLLGVLGQRLVRRLCPACRAPHAPDAAERALAGLQDADAPLYRAVGCPACNGTGYRGRAGIYELLTVDETLRSMIHDAAPEQALRSYAVEQGMVGMREDGMRWVRGGETALEEVLRATREG
ncbi:type II secretion system protein GspE [Betaproteobacteria bacterium SCN1]|jgi:general secretion pathway protein E|nr:type II secretion system protein GspE [Betaproteobacteria bacterium SCN1]MBN8760618.1 type II secretion system ATPase GspE [Thiobacillus sp.]ODU88051.1 MAG: type II secretion system protein GspE [Thiobacillus sp. SCN 65-179]OJW36299.1 MAG: type II secretion system protein GspE [Thiobacillus sp. 65-69]